MKLSAVECVVIVIGGAGLSLALGVSVVNAVNFPPPVKAQSQGVREVPAYLRNEAVPATITFNGTASSDYVVQGNWTVTTANAVYTPGFYFVGNSGVANVMPSQPRNARFHAVTDTYFDENGKVVGKEVVAHVIDPLYCQPGHRPQDEPRVAMPQSVRELVAEGAAVEQYAPTILPESTSVVKLAEVK